MKTRNAILFLFLIAASIFVAGGFGLDSLIFENSGRARTFVYGDNFAADQRCFLDTGEVDIVFCMDTSRSMEPYIEDLQTNITEFIDSIVALGYDFRIGAVPFDDSTNVWDFDAGTPGNQMTADTTEFNSWLGALGVSTIASDSWEVSLDAICDALNLYEWRDDALRIIIMFTNEGYHSTDDDTDLSDVSFEETLDTVLSKGAVVFIAASSRPPYVGSPIPPEQMANLISLADTSGGHLDSLTTDWTFILDDVVSLISTFNTVIATITNETGFSTVVYTQFVPIDSSCMGIHSENPVSSVVPLDDGRPFRAIWKVIVDSTCADVEKCFEIVVWGGGETDTFFGCFTDDSCYGYTDVYFEHTTPSFTTTCATIYPNPVNLTIDLYNDGIRPATDVELSFASPSPDVTIVGGDPNPWISDALDYYGSETITWQVQIAPEGAGESHLYRIGLSYNESSPVIENRYLVIPDFEESPEVTISCADSILCPGECADLNASVTPPGSWAYSWTPTSGLDSPTSHNPTACPDTTTLYTVVVTDGIDCTDNATINVVVADEIFVDAGPDDAIFPGREIVLGGSPTGSGGYGSLDFSWSPTSYLSDPASPNPTASPFFPTEYIVTVTDDAGCNRQDTVIVDIQPPLGYIYVQDETEILELRVIDSLDAIISDNGIIMVTMPGGIIGAADLVDSLDTWASPVLIQTTRGIRAWRHKMYIP